MHSTLALLFLSLSSVAAASPNDSFLEEALFAGGARDQAELERLVALYHQRLDPIVEVVRDQPQEIAAKLLLKHLYVSYGGTTAVLKEYVLGEWSLNRALETGKFNCLSASMLFVLAGRQAGLDVTGEVYPGHARAVVTIGNWVYRVETTNQDGFGVADWYLESRMDVRTGALSIAVVTPRDQGLDALMDGAWAWAGDVRDARWSERVARAPARRVTIKVEAVASVLAAFKVR